MRVNPLNLGFPLVFRAILLVGIATIGFFVLYFRSRSQLVGSYIYTDDYTTRNIESWRDMLYSLAGKPNILALEVGTFEGRSAVWLLENILTELNFDRNMKPFAPGSRRLKRHLKSRSAGLNSKTMTSPTSTARTHQGRAH
jgi:hypothetical protein